MFKKIIDFFKSDDQAGLVINTGPDDESVERCDRICILLLKTRLEVQLSKIREQIQKSKDILDHPDVSAIDKINAKYELKELYREQEYLESRHSQVLRDINNKGICEDEFVD